MVSNNNKQFNNSTDISLDFPTATNHSTVDRKHYDESNSQNDILDDSTNHNSVSGVGTSKTNASSDGAFTGPGRLSEAESRKVFRLRVIVIVVLIFIAFAVSGAVFKITVQGEIDEFETEYDGAATKVIDAFEDIMNKMGSVAGLGVSFTSQGQRGTTISASTWPFVSLDDFHLRANNVLQLSGALMVGMSPVLRGSLFGPWDNYVDNPANQIWIEESLAHQEARGFPIPPQQEGGHHYTTNVRNENRVVDVMHYYKGGTVIPEVPGREWYLPMWQTCPYVAKGLVNNNMLRYENTTVAVHHVYESESAVLGRMITAPPGSIASPDPDTALLATLRSAQKAEAEASVAATEGSTTSIDYLGDPMTDLFIPVFDNTVDVATRKVVGVLNALIHWKSYFRNVLPSNIHGIVVVLEYTCNNDDDAPITTDDNSTVEGRRSRQRRTTTQEATTTAATTSSSSIRNNFERNMATTFTIIAHTPDTDAPSTVPPAEERAPTTPESASSSPYWDAKAHTPVPTTSYWNDADSSSTSNATFISYATKAPSEEDLPPPHPSTIREEQETEEPIDMTSSSMITEQTYGNEEASYFTYIIEGTEAHVLGTGDLHDPSFDDHMRRGSFVGTTGAKPTTLADGTVTGIPIDSTCTYNIYVYPSQSFYLEYASTQPLEITLVVVSLFIFAIITFLFYNRMVERRQTRILKKATQSTAIVSSLFPKNVRDRLLAGGSPEALGAPLALGNKSRLKGFMAGGEANEQDSEAPPIADLFPHCTVFFADIAGFTAWSSTREPSQVFILLQAVYQAFDQLAKRRRVFKVETIGDCYMAVTGLPDPQDSHASIMVRFSYDCITKMREVTKRLESQLGPDTTELSMRIGLHSGPVTAGVLRGDRARFQLFGDTVNTASRMESTGIRGKIQVSEATANILREHGRGDWLIPRADSVKAKGKGVLKTYWANPKMRNNLNSKSSMSVSSDHGDEETSDSTDEVGTVLQQSQLRLVDWIVKLLSDDIRRILFVRQKGIKVGKNAAAPSYFPPEGATCMDEVKEVIHMPKFDASKVHSEAYKKIQIDSEITRELSELVAGIAQMYRHNPFHNFEHACHVTMSVNKLIRRIVAPELSAEQVDGFGNATESRIAAHLHDYTYGINSDPLAMFAMTFSALIHDVDHRGISNLQLAIEFPDMATKYHKKSLAEQNSLDLAWDLLMEDRFANLRKYIFVSEMELMRFRQLIVNVVLATDIFDKELNDLRKNRWKRAFSGEEEEKEDIPQSDLKATIVIEHIIQASDVSHTMQHWHVYQKWNKCLFREMHSAYKAGRLAKDPASFWYKGEIGFFDNYIIPLAKKLKDCGVFGVSSDEYLNYAVQNRAEWEERGSEIVAGLVAEVTKAELSQVEQAPALTKRSRANSFEVDESMSSRGRGRASVTSPGGIGRGQSTYIR